MVFNSIWPNICDAYGHIKSHNGFGDLCEQDIRFGINVYNNTYAHISYGNG